MAIRFTVTTANLRGKDAPPVPEYVMSVRRSVSFGFVCFQEHGAGRKANRVRARGCGASPVRRTEIGEVGAHRWVAWREAVLAGVRVRVISIHALHVGSVGKRAQAKFYRALRRWLRSLTREGIRWVLAGDLNRAVRKVARTLKAKAFAGVGVDGVLVSRGLRIVGSRVSYQGKNNRWTDHPSVSASVEVVSW